jgi:ABC-type amino acid transport substrate-binding protein
MKLLRLLLSLFFLSLIVGCATTPQVAPDPSLLRIGVTPDMPPMIDKQGGEFVGVEADFAKELAAALDRDPVFVDKEWEELLPALEANQIDIVMSGMSITPARSFRVLFTYPYMTAGLTPIFRRNDYASSGMIPSVVRHQTSTIGCVRNTTGAIYAQNAYLHAEVVPFSDWEQALKALYRGKVNMVVHDAPAVWWAASRYEEHFVAFPELLNREELAWAVARSNSALHEEVNAVLEQWRESGKGGQILKQWFPNM